MLECALDLYWRNTSRQKCIGLSTETDSTLEMAREILERTAQ